MPKAVAILMDGKTPNIIMYSNHHICQKLPKSMTESLLSMFRGDGTVMFQKYPGIILDCDSNTLLEDITPQSHPLHSPAEIRCLAKCKGYPLKFDFYTGLDSRASVAKIIKSDTDSFEEIIVSPSFVEQCINSGVDIYWLEYDWRKVFNEW